MTRLFYTPPLPIVDHPADAAHFTRGTGLRKRLIIIHHSGGTNSAGWLSTNSQPPVSAHRLITKSGINIKIVADEDIAFTTGFGVVGPVDPDANDPAGVAPNLNHATFNIELENKGDGRDPYPVAQMRMCAAQIVEWWGAYGWLGLLGHKEVDSRKNDPAGFDWDWLNRLILTRLLEIGVVTP